MPSNRTSPLHLGREEFVDRFAVGETFFLCIFPIREPSRIASPYKILRDDPPATRAGIGGIFLTRVTAKKIDARASQTLTTPERVIARASFLVLVKTLLLERSESFGIAFLQRALAP